MILLSCETDYDADTFSYVDVLKKAKFLVDQVSIPVPAFQEVWLQPMYPDIDCWGSKVCQCGRRKSAVGWSG